MNTKQLLASKQISPSSAILEITAEEAVYQINEALLEFSIDLDLNRLSKEELQKLLSDFADAVVNYHPDDYHQERAALLRNQDMLLKYGLSEDDIEELDFT